MAKITVSNQNNVREHMGFAHYPLISWRSIAAGLIFSIICYVALTALGVAVMGASADQLIGNGTKVNAGSGFAMGAGIWTIVSVLISLMVGGYFAARISNLVTGKMGGAQGVVIASLFFSLLLYGAGNAIGAIGKGMGNAAKAMSGSTDTLFSSQIVQDTVEQSFEGLNLKSSPEIVARGLAARILRGDDEGARNYLAYQAGVPVSEVESRIATMKEQATAGMTKAASATAQGMQAAGWTVFLSLVLGLFACVVGGLLGARANTRKPLVDQMEPVRLMPQAM